MVKYIEIDFNKVAGYENLSEPAKKVFECAYKTHNSCKSLDYKEKWLPVKIIEHKHYYIEVHFANGEMRHYLPNGTWY